MSEEKNERDIGVLLSFLETLREENQDFPSFIDWIFSDRQVPIALFIHGHAGTGKTLLVQIVQSLLDLSIWGDLRVPCHTLKNI